MSLDGGPPDGDEFDIAGPYINSLSTFAKISTYSLGVIRLGSKLAWKGKLMIRSELKLTLASEKRFAKSKAVKPLLLDRSNPTEACVFLKYLNHLLEYFQ